jgi:hypothetical protein
MAFLSRPSLQLPQAGELGLAGACGWVRMPPTTELQKWPEQKEKE